MSTIKNAQIDQARVRLLTAAGARGHESLDFEVRVD